MKIRALLFFIITFPLLAHAESGGVLPKLIAEAWQPKNVRVEWENTGAPPAALAAYDDWKLAAPLPRRLAGSMALTLERMNSAGKIENISVSGTARVFGPSLTVKEIIPCGLPIRKTALTSLDGEWTHLVDDAASENDISDSMLAAHALLPGRILVVRDLKLPSLVLRGQMVDVQYCDGAVRLHLHGRALQSGGAGDRIPVSVNMNPSRKFEAVVAADGSLTLAR